MSIAIVRPLLSSLVLVGLVSTGACTTGPGGDGDGDGDGDAKEQLLDAYADWWVRCLGGYEGDFVAEVEGDDVDDVIAALRANIRKFLERQILSDDVDVDEDRVSGCIALLGGSCTVFAEGGTACDDVFVGALVDGEPCTSSIACRSGVCEMPYDADCGVCVPDVPAQAGETCFQRDCVESAQCHWSENADGSSNYVCEALRGVGEACVEGEGDDTEYFDCLDGLECTYLLNECTAPVPGGGTCIVDVPPDSTATLECAVGFSCDYSTRVCVALADVGEACGYDAGTGAFIDCDVGLGCVGDVCELLPSAGESCAETYDCDEDARCDFDTNICVALPGEGGDCSETYACLSGLECDWETDVCVVAHPEGTDDGDPCYENGEGCEYPLLCVGDLGDQVCRAPVQVGEGEACDNQARHCGQGYDTGLYCDPTSGQCEAIEIVDDGEDCAHPGLVCRDGLSTHHCSATTGTCTENAEPGDACASYAECGGAFTLASCDYDENGLNGTCVTTAYPGEACDDEVSYCAYGECVDGTCVVETCE